MPFLSPIFTSSISQSLTHTYIYIYSPYHITLLSLLSYPQLTSSNHIISPITHHPSYHITHHPSYHHTHHPSPIISSHPSPITHHHTHHPSYHPSPIISPIISSTHHPLYNTSHHHHSYHPVISPHIARHTTLHRTLQQGVQAGPHGDVRGALPHRHGLALAVCREQAKGAEIMGYSGECVYVCTSWVRECVCVYVSHHEDHKELLHIYIPHGYAFSLV